MKSYNQNGKSKSEINEDASLKQIKKKFFLKYNIAQVDGTGRIFEVYRNNDDKVAETYQPNHEGKILLAKYYQDKYGILIFNISDRQDCQNLIKYVSGNKENFKVGVLLPSAMEGQQRQDSALEKYDRDTSSRSHCCPIIIERFGDKNVKIIDLDCITRTTSQNSNFISLINNVAHTEMYVTRSSNVMDTNSCHTYALSILKDALRIDDLAEQITLTNGVMQFETRNSAGLTSKIYQYQKLPMPLLKLTQSESYLRTDELETEKTNENFVIRSNPQKENLTLKEQREKHSEYIKYQESSSNHAAVEEAKIRNSFLWEKAEENPRRILHLLKDLKIHSPEQIDQLVQDLRETQFNTTPNSVISATVTNPIQSKKDVAVNPR